MRNGTVTSVALEDHLVVSYKTEHTLAIWSSKHAPWYDPKWTGMIQFGMIQNELKTYVHKTLHTAIYGSFTHNF